MSDNLFNAEIHDCDLVSRIEEQPEVTREELSDAQSEWEAEQYEWTEDQPETLPWVNDKNWKPAQ